MLSLEFSYINNKQLLYTDTSGVCISGRLLEGIVILFLNVIFLCYLKVKGLITRKQALKFI